MGFVVKNTTNFGLLDLLCPHTCRGCGQLGTVLCECCKKNLLKQKQSICPICKQIVVKPAKKVKNITSASITDPNIQIIQKCPTCETPFQSLWSFGWRTGVLEQLVEEYKYQSVRAMGAVLVDLYAEILPPHLQNLIIVPLPTIGKHIRARGFDHTLTLAKKLAQRRGWSCKQLLVRAADTVQVGAKVAARQAQAAKAYAVHGQLDPQAHYLLLDDVWTTGSTMLSAAKILRAAGATQISAVVLAVSKAKTTPDAA